MFSIHIDTFVSAERASIFQKIGDKEGIDRFVEFVNPQDILKTVNEVLKGLT